MSWSKKSIFHLNGRDSAGAILKQGLYHAFNPGQFTRGGSFEQDIKNILVETPEEVVTTSPRHERIFF